MPAWRAKDERAYEHIKTSSRKRGASPSRAREIASRTVNKRRREEGLTPNRTTQGSGNPNRRLETRSKRELYNLAKKRHIGHRSQMSKNELIDALRH